MVIQEIFFRVMDFGIRNPANYEILESKPSEIGNTLSWNPESSIWNARCERGIKDPRWSQIDFIGSKFLFIYLIF